MVFIKDWPEYLEHLKTVGCEILERSEDGALVSIPGTDGSVGLLVGDPWLHAAIVVVERAEIDESGHRAQLNEFVLRLHSRMIGCRFGIKDDGSLGIMVDIYPAMQDAQLAADVFNQLEWVALAMLPLVESTLKTGCVPGDDEIEAFFGAAWEEEDL